MHSQIYINPSKLERKGLPVPKTCEVKGCNKEAGYYFPFHERFIYQRFLIKSVCLKHRQWLEFMQQLDKFFITMRTVINAMYFKYINQKQFLKMGGIYFKNGGI